MPERDDRQSTPASRPSLEGLAPGQAFGQYTLVEEVGRGGMGVVWKAHHPVLHRDDALKFLSPQLARSDEARERFIREGRSASALKHNGIATVYSAGETDGKVYIAQEFIDGKTVSELVANGPLAAAEAFRVAIFAGRAIGYAHGRGVLHRDVTSRNVMITRDGNVVVVDFGLAVVQGETRFTRSGAVVGTLPYMAPELFAGGKASDATDVYGLGVVLYEMLTGSVPFQEKYEAALMWLIANREPDPPSARVEKLTPEVDRIISKALAKDPVLRYQSAEALVADLEALLQQGVLPDVAPDKALVRPPSPSPTPSRARRQRRKRWAIGLATLAGIAVALSFYFWGRLGGPQPAFASVAVLPFETVGPTSDVPDWLLSGLGEQLTSKLAKLEGCRVVTWASSRNFSAKDQAIRDIAKKLGVEGIVLVSMRSDGGRLTGPSRSSMEAMSSSRRRASSRKRKPISSRSSENWRSPSPKGCMDELPGKRIACFPFLRRKAPKPTSITSRARTQYRKEHRRRTAVRWLFLSGRMSWTRSWRTRTSGRARRTGVATSSGGGGDELDFAERSYRKALDLDPDNLAAIQGLISMLSDKGQLEEGLRLGARVPTDEQATVDQLMTKAQAYFACGPSAKAIPLYERVISMEPSHQGAHFFLAITFAWSGEYARCIEQGETYFSKFGEDPEIHLWVAVSHDALGNVEEAAVHYRRSLDMFTAISAESRVFPNAAKFFMRIGRTEQAHEILTEGIESTKRLLAASPGNGRLMDALGDAYALQGDRERFLEVGSFSAWGWGYFLVGLGDVGADYFCELVRRRSVRVDPWFLHEAPASFLADKRVQDCLEENRRWLEDMAKRY